MNVGIIGAGLIGNKRAVALANFKNDRILAVADIDEQKARSLAKILGCEHTTDSKKIATNREIDIVIVSTINKYLAPLCLQALKAGKHVLCEKPLGVNTKEIAKCVAVAKRKKLIYKAGYNHRFHPAIIKAHELVDSGSIGKLMFIKSSYGHGARPNYHKEWRAKKSLSGGGELLDQGCHVLDLMLWFSKKKVTQVQASLGAKFWPISPLEDNAFVLLELGDASASFHTSWTQWKNEFVFEVYGKDGYLKVNGLGGSYGKETLIFGKRIPGKVPIEKRYEFDGPDESWIQEWKNFKQAIKDPKKLLSPGSESLEIIGIIEKIYTSKTS
mgnify:CR=1 FL=1